MTTTHQGAVAHLVEAEEAVEEEALTLLADWSFDKKRKGEGDIQRIGASGNLIDWH